MTQNVHLREAQTAAQVPGPQVTAFPRYGQFLSQNGHFWPKNATFGLKRPVVAFLGPKAKNWHFWPKMANFGPFGPLKPKMGIFGLKWPILVLLGP